MALALEVVTSGMTPGQRYEWMQDFDDVKHEQDRRAFAQNFG